MSKYDALLAYARTVEGQRLLTLSQSKPFTVRVEGDSLLFTPEGKAERGTTTRKVAERLLERQEENGSMKPGDYVDLSYNASYFLALLDRLNSQA